MTRHQVPQPGMTDAETAAHLRRYVAGQTYRGMFSWPTDACGYDQHMRFVEYRNTNWHGQSKEEFDAFVLAYAESLDPAP